MKPGASTGKFARSKLRYSVEEVENSNPVDYVVTNGIGTVVAGPFLSKDEAEMALKEIQDAPNPE